MTRAEVLRAFEIASISFAAMTMNMGNPSPEVIEAMTDAVKKINAAHTAVNELLRRMEQ